MIPPSHSLRCLNSNHKARAPISQSKAGRSHRASLHQSSIAATHRTPSKRDISTASGSRECAATHMPPRQATPSRAGTMYSNAANVNISLRFTEASGWAPWLAWELAKATGVAAVRVESGQASSLSLVKSGLGNSLLWLRPCGTIQHGPDSFRHLDIRRLSRVRRWARTAERGQARADRGRRLHGPEPRQWRTAARQPVLPSVQGLVPGAERLSGGAHHQTCWTGAVMTGGITTTL